MDQLLATKLHIPQPNFDLVSRPRLYELLDDALTRKLTLASAPAGFGKSSLVTGWLSERNQSAAWFSLDRGDDDPVRFWTYLIAAIQTIHQEMGVEARQIICAPHLRSTEPVSISLINDISQYAHHLIVVLDDYHVIDSKQIHTDLSYLLEHQPANLHTVLLTRADPPVSLARLRAHRQLVEIRAKDLQFSIDEAAILFNEKMGLNLKPGQIEALNTHTESWVVGLQLAALSLKGQASYDAFVEEFTGGHQFILDYLAEEVLDTLPEAQRKFLLRTSILERFCGKLCRAVTGDPSSHRMLDEIRKSNLFLIPLDTDGRWFRYHHLFAEVLHALLERDHPLEIQALHLKAAEWFDNEGHPSEAVDHALRSGDMALARDLILNTWLAIVHRGEVATVLRWLDALPVEMGGDDPSVPLARCWALFISGKDSAIEPHLERATITYERLVGEGHLSGARKDLVAAQLSMMRSVQARCRGQHSRSVAHAEEAARLVPQDMLGSIGTAWSMLAAAHAGAGDYNAAIEAHERGISFGYAEGNLTVAYGCTYGQAMYLLLQGRLREAERLCHKSIDRAVGDGHGSLPASGWLHIAMARINLERNHLDAAEAYLGEGLRISLPGGFGEVERSGRYLQAFLSAARGDKDAAVNVFQATERVVNATDDPYQIGELNREWAKLCIMAGDLDVARERLKTLEEKSGVTHHANLLLGLRWLYPRILCDDKRYGEALEALAESIHHARAKNSNGELIRLLGLQAVALDGSGDRMPALFALREAVTLAAAGGYVRMLLDAGPGLASLLGDLRDHRDLSRSSGTYLDSLLNACLSTFGESVQSGSGELLEPLTRRELEIMRLICNGYSNQEIAAELVVTINTVKKHTSNIYGKLGVRSRTQAIARARKSNLL